MKDAETLHDLVRIKTKLESTDSEQNQSTSLSSLSSLWNEPPGGGCSDNMIPPGGEASGGFTSCRHLRQHLPLGGKATERRDCASVHLRLLI